MPSNIQIRGSIIYIEPLLYTCTYKPGVSMASSTDHPNHQFSQSRPKSSRNLLAWPPTRWGKTKIHSFEPSRTQEPPPFSSTLSHQVSAQPPSSSHSIHSTKSSHSQPPPVLPCRENSQYNDTPLGVRTYWF